MKIKILAAAAVGFAALSMGSVANASTMSLGTCTSTSGTITCSQADDTITFKETGVSGMFSSTVNFTNSAGGLYAIILESTTRGFTFTNVSLNGSSIWSGPASNIVNLIDVPLGAGLTDNLTFTANAPNLGGDTGSITFSLRAVPEPATWAMMLLGFAGIGFAMRRRGSASTLAQIA